MIKIKNNTNFFYKELGEIIDNISWNNRGDTNYVGKVDYLKIKYKRQKINITIKYLKTCVIWIFNYDE